MSRRAKLVWFVAAAATFGAGLWLILPKPGITVYSRARIEFGMSERDVERVFGCPAGDYRTTKVALHYSDFRLTAAAIRGDKLTSFDVIWLGGKQWLSDEFCTAVLFDENRRVKTCLEPDGFWFGYGSLPEPFWDRIRRWLYLQ